MMAYDLVERLEAPSAEMAVSSLATEMFRLFEPDFVAHLECAQADFLPIRPNDVEAIRTPESYVSAHAPHYTTSLDDALDLVRKRLPPHEHSDQVATEVRLQICDMFTVAHLDRDTFSGDHIHAGRGSTPALAVCAAMVRARTATRPSTADKE